MTTKAETVIPSTKTYRIQPRSYAQLFGEICKTTPVVFTAGVLGRTAMTYYGHLFQDKWWSYETLMTKIGMDVVWLIPATGILQGFILLCLLALKATGLAFNK